MGLINIDQRKIYVTVHVVCTGNVKDEDSPHKLYTLVEGQRNVDSED